VQFIVFFYFEGKMGQALRIGLKCAIVGFLAGSALMLYNNLRLWQRLPNLIVSDAVAQVVGGGFGMGVFFFLCGYGYALSKKISN
jgi:hypothetical protein